MPCPQRLHASLGSWTGGAATAGCPGFPTTGRGRETGTLAAESGACSRGRRLESENDRTAERGLPKFGYALNWTETW